MSFSDIKLINTLDTIQEELTFISEELTTIMESMKPLETRKKLGPKKSGFLIWNSFVNVVKLEMESNGSQMKYDDIVKKAIEMKKADPESYRLFSETWSP
jgi:hypothetical protein